MDIRMGHMYIVISVSWHQVSMRIVINSFQIHCFLRGSWTSLWRLIWLLQLAFRSLNQFYFLHPWRAWFHLKRGSKSGRRYSNKLRPFLLFLLLYHHLLFVWENEFTTRFLFLTVDHKFAASILNHHTMLLDQRPNPNERWVIWFCFVVWYGSSVNIQWRIRVVLVVWLLLASSPQLRFHCVTLTIILLYTLVVWKARMLTAWFISVIGVLVLLYILISTCASFGRREYFIKIDLNACLVVFQVRSWLDA